MDTHKAKQLEAAGWKIGNASDFLGLSPEEAELIEFKLGAKSGDLRRAVAPRKAALKKPRSKPLERTL